MQKKTIQENFKVAHQWAHSILDVFGYEVIEKGRCEIKERAILVGNHVSFLDIPLILSRAPITFVSKKEVRRWPVIGAGAAALGCIFLDRSSFASRKNTLKQIGEEINQNNKIVCLFPEGTTSVEGVPWKWGAFKVAAEFKVPIQAFALCYIPLNESAYGKHETLVENAWRVLSFKKKKAIISWMPPTQITSFEDGCKKTSTWVKEEYKKIQAEYQKNI